jgi:hypothetical protein
MDAIELLGPGTEPVAVDSLTQPHEDLVGALAVPLGSGGRSWVVWYRRELVGEVRWAGDPHSDEVVTGPGGVARLGPRRSFATFVESVTGRCRPWSAADRVAAGELGSQVGAVLERRTHDRLSSALVVQRALLLDADVAAPGFDVAVRYLPAHGDPVGGDWHDIVLLPGGSTAFVVGDAAGHGIEVAGVMAQLRNALRAYLVAGMSPGAALGRLDELVHQLLPGQMATAVVCVVDPADGRARVAVAGHLPPLLIGPGGVTALQVPRSPALGLGSLGGLGEPGDLEHHLEVDEGLVLFSDGLVERRTTPIPVLLGRVSDALSKSRSGGDAGVLCGRAIAATGPDGSDDVTVLACVRVGTGRS